MNLSPLEKFLPKDAIQYLYQWLGKEQVVIKIKPSRRTKLGDYKYFRQSKSHQITIDHALSPEAFFFVLTHEIAHLLVHVNYLKPVKSHGIEWKLSFRNLLMESLEVYSEEIQPIIIQHARNPKASMGADKTLRQKLFLTENDVEKLVENLNERQKFRLRKRLFEKGPKRKIRYICKELTTGKMYLVNGQAIVDEIISE